MSRMLSNSGIEAPLGDSFTLFLLQVVVILCACKLTSAAIARVNIPAVVGEMLAGVILGPTVLGRIPGWLPTLFPSSSLGVLSTISTFGLCFFMFSVGLELDLAKVSKHIRTTTLLTFCGICVPGAASFALALLFLTPAYSSSSLGLLGLFLTCVLGITSLPMLARMLGEREMLHTPIGEIVMSVAVLEDIVSYVLLAVVVVLLNATSELGILWVILLCIAESLLLFYVARPVIRIVVARAEAMNSSRLQPGTFLLLVLILLIFCLFTNVIGLTYLIGAFQVGLIFPRDSIITEQLSSKVESFTLVVLMPLYFANSGLKTDFSLINSGESVGLTVLLIVGAGLSKAGAVYLGCRYVAMPPVMSRIVSSLVTCKGLVALVTINIGLSAKAITPKFFSILVLFVLVSTVLTIPLVDLVGSTAEVREQELKSLLHPVVAVEEEGAALAAAAAAAADTRQVLVLREERKRGASLDGTEIAVSASALAQAELGTFRLRSRAYSEDQGGLQVPTPRLGAQGLLPPTGPSPTLLPTAASPTPQLLALPALAEGREEAEEGEGRGASGKSGIGAVEGEEEEEEEVQQAPKSPVALPVSPRQAAAAAAAAVSLPPPQPHATPPHFGHRLLLAVTDSVNAGRLVTLANLFSPQDAALDVLWLQGDTAAPSAFMNSMESLRDVPMKAALESCTGRSPAAGNLSFASLPTGNPWLAARHKAADLGSDILLCSYKLVAHSQGLVDVLTSMSTSEWSSLLGLRGGSAAEASATAVAADRRPALRAVARSMRSGELHSTLAVFFDSHCPATVRTALSWGGAGVQEFLSLVAMEDLQVVEALAPAGQGAMGMEGAWPEAEAGGDAPLVLLSGDAEEGEGEEALVEKLESWICLCAAKGASALVVFRRPQRERGASLREEGGQHLTAKVEEVAVAVAEAGGSAGGRAEQGGAEAAI